jgi:hypothetical protein
MGARQIVSYMLNPSYTFHDMAHQIGTIIQEREGSTHGVWLFGDISDSVSLEIGTNSLNSLLITNNLDAKLMKYHPNYMIVHTSNIVDVVAKQGGYIVQLGAWDVFGNYYANGEQVRLYFVEWAKDGKQ